MAGDDTKFSSQSLDRRSFNDTYGVYEHLAYGDNGDGTISAIPRLQGISIPPYDYCALVQAELTDTWTFKTGGASGTTVATVVITYTDATKATISNVVRT